MKRTENGLAPAGPGWFVVNTRDAVWEVNERLGDGCIFESDEARFEQIGYDLHVLRPGQPNGLYHREANQEDFLVLSGECLLLVEGEERRLKAWDFVHCPPGTEHIFVGAGEGPCLIFHGGRALTPRHQVHALAGGGRARGVRGDRDLLTPHGLPRLPRLAARAGAELRPAVSGPTWPRRCLQTARGHGTTPSPSWKPSPWRKLEAGSARLDYNYPVGGRGNLPGPGAASCAGSTVTRRRQPSGRTPASTRP
ncbi:MAG TPA: cupin domain-containing protein [Solirubrobacteraceae bacterium]|nr:cupin domain-containing protein [Solirubrobacteraceae bacterium]